MGDHGGRQRANRGGRTLLAAALFAGLQAGAPAAQSPEDEAGPPTGALLSSEAAAAPIFTRGPRADVDGLTALVLATAPPPPGLTASRRAEREAQRRIRLDELGALLEGPLGRARHHVIEGWLLDPARDVERWAAAAAAVGDLRLVSLAPSLAAALDEPATSPLRAVARRTLHAIYGVWFADAAAFEPFARMEAGATLDGYRAALAAREAEQAVLRRYAWETEPRRALDDLVATDADVRTAAATALQGWLRDGGDGGLGADEVAAVVIDRLGREPDTFALCAQLELGVELLRDAPADDARVVAVRELVDRGLRTGPIAILPCTARAAATLPIPSDPAGGASVAAPLAVAVGRCASSGTVVDPDASVAVLSALRQITIAVGRPALAQSLGRDALVAPVLDLASLAGAPDTVRRAATAALADVAAPADLDRLAARLVPEGAAMEDGVLDVLAALAEQLEPGAPGLERAARGALSMLAVDSVDRRRRAVAVLRLPSIEPAIDGAGRAAIVERFGRETSGDLRLELLDVLRAIGGPRELELVLGQSELVVDDALAEALAATVDALAGGDAALLAQGARRVAEAGSLRAKALALALVVDAPDDVAARFTADDHAEAVRWGLSLLDAGALLDDRDEPTSNRPQVLSDRHLPAAESLGAVERARASGSFAIAAGREPGTVEVGLSVALEDLRDDPGRWQLILDRARLRSRDGRPLEAAPDWRAALDPGDGSALVARLSLTDARAALADLLAVPVAEPSPAAGAEVPDDAALAVEIGLALLARAEWRLLAEAERGADLDRLVGASIASRRIDDLPRVGRHLDVALGTLPIAEAAVPDAEALAGSLVEPGLRERAAALRATLDREAQARDAAPVEGEGAGGDPPTEPAGEDSRR